MPQLSLDRMLRKWQGGLKRRYSGRGGSSALIIPNRQHINTCRSIKTTMKENFAIRHTTLARPQDESKRRPMLTSANLRSQTYANLHQMSAPPTQAFSGSITLETSNRTLKGRSHLLTSEQTEISIFIANVPWILNPKQKGPRWKIVFTGRLGRHDHLFSTGFWMGGYDWANQGPSDVKPKKFLTIGSMHIFPIFPFPVTASD